MKRVISLLIACSPCWAQNPFAKDPTSAEGGRGIFRIYCAPCHGLKADGGRGPDLTLGVFTAGEADQDLFRVIMNGVPGSEMPSYSENMGVDNSWRLVSYIRSLARREQNAQSGNPSNGSNLYWGKAGCGGCHQVGNQGGTMGPDLTLAGRRRSATYLRDSIVEVNKDLTPGFLTIIVETKDGRKITGTQRGYDTFSAQLVNSKGEYFSFYKDQVKSMKREARSLMPETYSTLLTPDEIGDLVAYMVSLRGAQ